MAGNWKMNLNHLEAITLVQKLAFSLTEQQLTDVEVVVLPPFTDLRSVQTAVDGDKLLIGYGAQDLSPHAGGAYTGDISGAMLAKLGCTYVRGRALRAPRVPRRGRRAGQREGQGGVRGRAHADLLRGRGAGDPRGGQPRGALLAQLDAGLDGLTAEQVQQIVIAYEPVWAIGTGKTATPGGRPGGLRRDPGPARPRCTAPRSARRSASSTADR